MSRAVRRAACALAVAVLLVAALVAAGGTAPGPAQPAPPRPATSPTPGTWTATAIPLPQVVMW